jgi:nitrate/nitrite transporter NarK
MRLLVAGATGRMRGGVAAIGAAVGAPALTGLLARPLGGRVADRAGPLLPLLGAAALMTFDAVPAVLWLLRLAGIERRARALGHIGLANYAGLVLGPLLATSLGGAGASQAVLGVAVPLATARRRHRPGRPANGAGGVAADRRDARTFGGATAKSSDTDLRTAIVPIFAAVVIISRTAGGGIPDRLGGRATVFPSVAATFRSARGVAAHRR